MSVQVTSILPKLSETIEKIISRSVPEDRKEILRPLIDYIQLKTTHHADIRLNFICTHNSRRSQFSQIWAKTAAVYYGVSVKCYSGGTEVTAFNERAVASIKRSGFCVLANGGSNPVYSVFYSEDAPPIKAFSKIYDNPVNESGAFAAVMTCSHAEQNCPYIPGADKRIPVYYEDPKHFDGTPEESAMYDARSMQIASEMFYVFSNVKTGK